MGNNVEKIRERIAKGELPPTYFSDVAKKAAATRVAKQNEIKRIAKEVTISRT